MKYIAHRGLSSQAPENTIPAFELAAEQDMFYGIECDIQTTADHQFVIMHDDSLYRMAKVKKDVKAMSIEEIGEVKIKSGSKIRSYPNIHVPTLDTYLSICRDYAKTAIIEVKWIHDITLLNDLINLIETYEGVSVVLISSNINYLKYLRAITGHDLQLVTEKITDAMLYDCRVNKIDFALKKTIIHHKLVAKLKRQGFKINVWTVNTLIEAKRFEAMGIDYLTTDRLLRVKKEVT